MSITFLLLHQIIAGAIHHSYIKDFMYILFLFYGLFAFSFSFSAGSDHFHTNKLSSSSLRGHRLKLYNRRDGREN